IQLMHGTFGTAAELSLQATTYASSHADAHLYIESVTQQMVAALRQGQFAQMQSSLEILISKVRPEIGLETEIWGYGGIALAQVYQGNHSAARLAAECALNAMKSAKPT